MPPFAKARPRVVRRGKGVTTFMPKTYQRSRAELKKKFGPVSVVGELFLRVGAYRRIPKSWGRKKKEEMRGALCTLSPDIDNIVGAVMDSLLEEDCIVVAIEAIKRWSDREDGEAYLDIEIDIYDNKGNRTIR